MHLHASSRQARPQPEKVLALRPMHNAYQELQGKVAFGCCKVFCCPANLLPSHGLPAVPAVVYAVGRLLRLSMSNLRTRIMYEDLPNTKRLVALCEDIYIARAEGELLLEGELYFAMISIYRSPQVLFELTKKKEA